MSRKRFVLIDDGSDPSIDSLTRVLELSGYVMLTGPAAAEAVRAEATSTMCWRLPPREHRARELLNGIVLLTHCLDLKGPTAHDRRRWTRQIKASQMQLELLYAKGLERDFLSGTRGQGPRET